MKYNLQISVIILSAIALSIGIPAAINRTQAANVVVASGSEISPASNDAVSDNQSSDILASNDSAAADSENISSEEVQNELSEGQTYSAVKSSSLATMQVGMVGVITAAGAEIPNEDTLLALADGTTTLDEVLGSGEAQLVEDEENTEPSEEDADVTSEDDDLDDAEGDEEYEEFGNLVIARVDSYVNVREGPSTDSAKLGKLYNNSVGELIRRTGDWLYISSGTVVGYVKAEYVVYGENAKGLIDEVMKKKATVTAGSLNFRSEPSKSGDVIKHLPRGGVYEVLGASEDGEWIKIKVDKKEGYVSAEYVTVASEFVSAESKEEEQARIAAEKEQARLEKEAEEQAKKAAEEEKKKKEEEKKKKEEEKKKQQEENNNNGENGNNTGENNTTEPADTGENNSGVNGDGDIGGEMPEKNTEAIQPADTTKTDGAAKGQAVVDFAVQFVGNPYVYGGTSLTKGADCSGFVLSVYKEFGVSLPHSATADQKMGVAVASLDEARPGDLLCYSGHVGIYIGGGKFVHASNPRTGIKIGDANYRKILAIRRIFE